MPRFGAVEEKTGKSQFVSVPSDIEIWQTRVGGDTVVYLDDATSDDLLAELSIFITRAYGNPPIKEISMSVKDDGTGEIVVNGKVVVLDEIRVGSESIVHFQKKED